MNDISKEIEKMADALVADDTGEPDDPNPEPDSKDKDINPDDPPKEDPKEDPKPDDDPKVDDPPDDPPADSDPEPIKDPEPDSEPDPKPDKDPKEDEVTTLKAEIIELKAAAKKDPEPEPKKELEPDPEPIKEVDFLAGAYLDDLTRDPEAFNKLLNTIYTKGIEAARLESSSSQEGILRSIPEIVKNNITVVSSIKKAGDKFYDENKDLKPWKKAVAAVFEEVAAENPDKTYSEILEDVGPKVRKRLDLQKKATESKPDEKLDDDDPKPNLPRNKGNKRQTTQKPKTDSLISELDEMNESLNSEE